MGAKSQMTVAKEKEKASKEPQETSEIEKLAESFGVQKYTDKMLEIKDTVSESFLQKKEITEETEERAKKQPWWRRGLKWVVGGSFTALMGKSFMEGKEKETEMVTETVAKGVDIVTDEEKLKKANDTMYAAMKAKKEIDIVDEKINTQWQLEPKEKAKNFIDEIKEKEVKYKDYGKKDAIKEAWKKTEFEYDEKTKEKKERNFFWRLFAFFPSVISTFKDWKLFEKLKETGAIERMKQGELMAEEAKRKVQTAEEKISKGIETKKIAFSAVFEENPGALMVSKNYIKQLFSLTRNADKYTSLERATQIRKIASQSVARGTAQFGPGFTKMKGFTKYMPGVSVKQRGGFMAVEIIGSALGKALREGAESGGLSRASGVFWEEVKDVENWKDACPIWGTIRSGKRLSNTNTPAWSRWTEFGLSLGMDVAMVAGIVGTLGTMSAPIVAARAAGGSAARKGIGRLAMKQVAKTSLKTSGEVVTKNVSKEVLVKGAGIQAKRSIALAAGGKWALRINLMMATIGEFFGDDVESVKSEVKEEAYNALLTDEQRYSIALMKAAKNGEDPIEREAFFAEEDKKRKEEIQRKEENQAAGILSTVPASSKEKEKEVTEKKDFKKEAKKETQPEKKNIFKIAKEEIVKKIAA